MKLLPSAQYGNVKVNEQTTINNQSQLLQGKNSLSFNMLLNNEDQSFYNTLILNNLQTEKLSCDATAYEHPQPPSKTKKTTLKSSTLQSSRSWFYFTNDSNKKVTIGVGNFMPSSYKYTIESNAYRTIWVSSPNQNIYLYKIEE